MKGVLFMFKTLLAQVKEFKKASFLTPCFMILEVIMETLMPFTMASIIDKGVEAGNINHIYKMGIVMVLLALVSLFSGIMGGKYGARASTGFARNLRKAMYDNIQTYSFSNIDKFSSKLKADLWIDDRNLGGLPDWGTIYEMVHHRLTYEDLMRRYESNDQHSSPKKNLFQRLFR